MTVSVFQIYLCNVVSDTPQVYLECTLGGLGLIPIMGEVIFYQYITLLYVTSSRPLLIQH